MNKVICYESIDSEMITIDLGSIEEEMTLEQFINNLCDNLKDIECFKK